MSANKKRIRDSFGSKFGVIAAAAGSAVGLGNIWKFPYITGQYGGAAFLIVYLIFIVAIGLPIMLSELVIGRKSGKNAFGAFRKLAPKTKWYVTGLLGVVAAYLILSFYGVIAGWSLNYVFESFKGSLANKSSEQISHLFNSFIASKSEPIYWQLGFMFITGLIVILGIHNGIEMFSKILMPLLVVILIILVFRSVTLPGAGKGISFLFKPDFSKLTMEGILKALGHAFFSLSLGMGTLITYGSYVKKNNNLANTALQVTIADTFIAILAGLAIIPAVFAFNLDPEEGPGLLYSILPNVFAEMKWGTYFLSMFFILLSVAALTSSISILEVVVAFLSEELKISRVVATIFAVITISILGVFCSLSFGVLKDVHIFIGKNVFDTLDFFAADVFLPLGGLLICLFVGWKLGREKILGEISNKGKIRVIYVNVLIIILRYIAPIAILIVLIWGIYDKTHHKEEELLEVPESIIIHEPVSENKNMILSDKVEKQVFKIFRFPDIVFFV